MQKKIVLLVAVLFVSAGFLSGCVENVDEGQITLTVDNVEKRQYNDDGEPASSGNIFLYVFFTIRNNASEELSTNSHWFNLKSDTGSTYDPEWIYGSGGSTAKSVSKGASESYYLAFEISEDSDVSSSWELVYDGWSTTKTASLSNIKSGFHDVYLATLSIDSYHYSDTGDSSWETPSEGNTYLYVNITLSNSADNDESISTNPYNFKLYTPEGGYDYDGDEEGVPDEITPGSQASWYLYFEIPEDATLDKLQYNTYGIAPVEAEFS